MKMLIINTASEFCYLSLIIDDKIENVVFSSFQKTSECLLPEIDKLLKKNKLNIKDLESIAICVGPGSFTGIRVGIATVKAINISLGIPIIKFNVFDCFHNKCFCLSKASGGGAYCFKHNKITYLNKDALNKVINEKPEILNEESNYFHNFKFAIKSNLIEGSINHCIRCFSEKKFTSLNDLIPIYVLQSQAEKELEEKIKKIKVLKIKIENANQIYEIEKECFSLPYSLEIIKNDIKNENKKMFGLYLDNLLIGYICYQILQNEFELERVCIIKKYRNLNLAEKLINKSFKKFKMQKCFLEVNKKNDYAIKLYIKLGFKEMGIRKNYYGFGEDALTMQKVF